MSFPSEIHFPNLDEFNAGLRGKLASEVLRLRSKVSGHWILSVFVSPALCSQRCQDVFQKICQREAQVCYFSFVLKDFSQYPWHNHFICFSPYHLLIHSCYGNANRGKMKWASLSDLTLIWNSMALRFVASFSNAAFDWVYLVVKHFNHCKDQIRSVLMSPIDACLQLAKSLCKKSTLNFAPCKGQSWIYVRPLRNESIQQ